MRKILFPCLFLLLGSVGCSAPAAGSYAADKARTEKYNKLSLKMDEVQSTLQHFLQDENAKCKKLYGPESQLIKPSVILVCSQKPTPPPAAPEKK